MRRQQATCATLATLHKEVEVVETLKEQTCIRHGLDRQQHLTIHMNATDQLANYLELLFLMMFDDGQYKDKAQTSIQRQRSYETITSFLMHIQTAGIYGIIYH